jgi:LPPG:FO 2-phospho-L-lactate transferase
MIRKIKVAALAGGVGGAKLAFGLSKVLSSGKLSVIVNTGDDFELFGLNISPDVDTVSYTLAGLANPLTGWGQVDETWQVYQALSRLGGPSWFKLGDHDLALHMERTRLLRSGLNLTKVTHELCSRMGVKDLVLPMTDQPVRTMVKTKDGRKLGFQEYFVKEQCAPEVTGFEFSGIEAARPSIKVRKAITEADIVILCPSNPWVSIDPILELDGFRDLMSGKPVIAVSPIIGGKTIKGPAAKMFLELGLDPSSFEVARHYKDFLSGFVLDFQDQNEADRISEMGIIPFVTQTIMRSDEDRIQLAKEVLDFSMKFLKKGA